MDRLSADLHRFFIEEQRPPQVTVADVLTIGRERIFGLVFALVGLILALPFPLSLHAIPIGLIILVWAVQLAVGAKSPWLPKRFVHQSIALETFQRAIKQGLPWLWRIEMFSRPRMFFIFSSFSGRLLIGVALVIVAMLIMLRLPGLNSIAGMGLLITGLGLMLDDGAISLTGLVVCLVAVVLGAFSAIALFWGGSSILGCPVPE